MKACKSLTLRCKQCKLPCITFLSRVELSVALRTFAFTNLFGLILLCGPVLAVFFGTLNIHPMKPKVFHHSNTSRPGYFLLYQSNRTNASAREENILEKVEETCGVDYRNNLEDVWDTAVPVLTKSLALMGTAFFFPIITATSYIVLHKKERLAFFIGIVHLGFVTFAVILSVYGVWFMMDPRLCLLDCFSPTIRIQTIFFVGVVIANIICKIIVLYTSFLFIRNHFKTPRSNRPPTPAEELYTYIKELKAARVKPKVKFELPRDLSKADWEDVEQIIKKMLVPIRIQVANLHKDDPYVNDLIQSGKLQGVKKKQVSPTQTRSPPPSILRIAQALVKEGSVTGEYTLLKQKTTKEGTENRDDVKIILPEPNLRFDDNL